MKKNMAHFPQRIAASLLVLLLCGCAQIIGAEENPKILPPSCKGKLSVRIASDFTGTATDIAVPYFFGLYDRLRWLNEQEGGLMGCPIDIAVADNVYTNADTQRVVDQWIAQDAEWKNVNTVFIFGTGPTSTVAVQLQKEEKVIIPGSYAGKLSAPKPVKVTASFPAVNSAFAQTQLSEVKDSPGYPYVFFPATDYGTGIRLAIQGAWQIAPGRIAMAHETADKCAYCVEPLAAGKGYLKNLQGMELGRDLIIPQTSNLADGPKIDALVTEYFRAEIEQVKANAAYKPVSWVWSGNSVNSTSLLGASLWKVQTTMIDSDMTIPEAVRKKWKLRVMANNWGIGETTAKICGDACKNDNFYGIFPVPRFGDSRNTPIMSQILAHHEAFTGRDRTANGPIPARMPGQYADVRYVQGFVSALLWEKGVTAAIVAGKRTPTGKDVKEALETFKNVSMGGATAADISFSPDDHRPQSGENVYKIDGNGVLSFVNNYQIQVVDEWLGW